MKDATSAVLSREKCTSLAELFSIELKFTIDTLKDWFGRIMKPKFFELDSFKKKECRKRNPVTIDALCSICDFPLNPEAENGWFNHVIKAAHLFLRNIYSESEIKFMNISNIESYREILYCLLNTYHHFETAVQDGIINDKIRDFMVGDLGDTYETFQELKKDIEKILKNIFLFPKNHFLLNLNFLQIKLLLFYILA